MTITLTTNDEGMAVLRATKRGATEIFGWRNPEGLPCHNVDTAVRGFERLNIIISARERKQMEQAVSSLGEC